MQSAALKVFYNHVSASRFW